MTYTEEELERFYIENPYEYDGDEEQSYEDWVEDILDTCDLFIIQQELGEDVANEILENMIIDNQ